MRHTKDGAQWELIDNKFENFAKDPRSIRLGECTDGMNPFGDMSTNNNTWLVILCIYNLAPWLCMKKKYIMMSMIIQGPKQLGNLLSATGRRTADSVDRCACCKML